MGNLKSATCKYCKMRYVYEADLYEVICPNCKKKITTPTGAKSDSDRNLLMIAKIVARLFRL